MPLTPPLRAQWILCTPSGSRAELLEQGKRLCQVDVCDCRHALAAVAKSNPDIIVFEFDDPIAEQLHLLQSVKRLHPSVPILMITSTHSEDLAVWAFRARVWNYLVKPVPLRELKSNLEQLAKVSRHREAVARQIERPGAMLPRASTDRASGHSERAVMQRIIEYLRRDHTSRVSIAQLARECEMSRFSLSRLFRNNFGCSCREYVTRLRIETACNMLKAPHPSVTHIAITTGFTDASYFARIFRRYMHTSPIAYAQVAAKTSPRVEMVGESKSA